MLLTGLFRHQMESKSARERESVCVCVCVLVMQREATITYTGGHASCGRSESKAAKKLCRICKRTSVEG